MLRVLAGLSLLALAASPVGAAEPPLLVNGSFDAWPDGNPAGWSVDVGARRGGGEASTVSRGPEGGVRLEATAETSVFRYVHQAAAIAPKATYRLSFEARLARAPREHPFGDAYVGVSWADPTAAGGRQLRIDVPARGEFTPGEVIVRGATTPLDVRVFLPHAGILDVRRVALERLAPESSFEVLVRHMDRYYAHFEGRDADWAERAWAVRSQLADPAEEAGFLAAAKDLLVPLADPHVWIRTSADVLVTTTPREGAAEPGLEAVAKRLRSPRLIGRVALAGEAADDVGYLAVATLQGGEATFREVAAALRGMLGRKGLVIDLRTNSGGFEARALALAAMLCDRPRVYALRRTRNGPAHADFGEPTEAWVRPEGGSPYTRPVVVLTGPGCLSSGEGFVQMLAVLPHVRLVGLPTRGASGNPAPVDLPNGVSVWFSRWVDMLPDGTPLEGRGVEPHLRVEPRPDGDAALDAGLADLRQRIGG